MNQAKLWSREIDLFIAFQHSPKGYGDVKFSDSSFNKVILKTVTGVEQIISLVPEIFKTDPYFLYCDEEGKTK